MKAPRQMDQWLGRVWIVQAAYYLVTGIWGVVGLRSFQVITGPKTDLWLVRTVALLVTVIGGVIAMAGTRRVVTPEVGVMAVGSAASLAAIDIVYVAKGRISRVYLLDALAGIGLIAAWVLAARCDLLPNDRGSSVRS